MINRLNKEDLEGLTDIEQGTLKLAGVLSDNPKLRGVFQEVIPMDEENEELLTLLLSLSETKKGG